MTQLIDAIAAHLLSGFIRACEDMTIPAGSPPVADVVQSGASIVQAGLLAPGESLPLAAVAIGFIVATVLILLRSQTSSASPGSELPTISVPAHSA
ncbi:MAG: hypothetical protein M3R03_09100 [Pseudomonadota bacterium]|nr:hypothetical protein [Pseudomonadota bacterium]